MVSKFRTLSGNVLDSATQDQVIATVNQLEKVKDITMLVGLLQKK